MVSYGLVQGYRRYSYSPEGSSTTYTGYVFGLALDHDPSDSTVGTIQIIVSFSDRDVGNYIPSLGDRIKFATYRDRYGRLKGGWILPVDDVSS